MIWTGPTDTNNTERDSNGLLITEVAQVRALRIARVYLHSLDHETTIAMLSSYCPGRHLISTVDWGHWPVYNFGGRQCTCTCEVYMYMYVTCKCR